MNIFRKRLLTASMCIIQHLFQMNIEFLKFSSFCILTIVLGMYYNKYSLGKSDNTCNKLLKDSHVAFRLYCHAFFQNFFYTTQQISATSTLYASDIIHISSFWYVMHNNNAYVQKLIYFAKSVANGEIRVFVLIFRLEFLF